MLRRAAFLLVLIVCHRPTAVFASSAGAPADRTDADASLTPLRNALKAMLGNNAGGIQGGLLPASPFGGTLFRLPTMGSGALGLQSLLPHGFGDALSTTEGLLQAQPMTPKLQNFMRSSDPQARQAQAIVGPSLLMVSGILFTVAFGIGTGAASIGAAAASIGTVAGPLSWGVQADRFLLDLTSGALLDNAPANAYMDRWVASMSNIAQQLQGLRSGVMRSNLASMRGQLANVQSLIKAVQSMPGLV